MDCGVEGIGGLLLKIFVVYFIILDFISLLLLYATLIIILSFVSINQVYQPIKLKEIFLSLIHI